MPAPAERLPIRTLSSLTGVSPLTLRAWERRYGLIQPLRTPKGHRLYTHQHVELIRRVLALTGRGVPIGQVRAALESAEPATDAPGGADPWTGRMDRMAAAIARFDERELDHVYEAALAVHAVEHVTQRLLLPLLERLGARWQGLPGAIAEEHFFATYLRSKLGARLVHGVPHAEGARVLAACAPGEHHEFGLLLFALEAAAARLRPVLLGADVPVDELVAAQRRATCDAIVVSSSVDPAPGFLHRELPQLVRGCCVPVFVGGATAIRHRAAIGAAGAVALGTDVGDGVRLIHARLARPQTRKR
ncbi:MAG TPA: MerR family transcriptional regulator [Usitatibacter sp.]|nr:MerR family transcriptional regulator [Usitatibacter sp.]